MALYRISDEVELTAAEVNNAISRSIAALGGGTVTSVSFTGGLISVATATTTPALTVAGTSGGIPYFSAATTWATSAALAANALVIGGGAGAAPATTTTGTGVLAALGVNTGSAGAFVTFNGALGTPSSGTVTNLTGTASININGTVGATTPTTGAFTSLTANNFSGQNRIVNGDMRIDQINGGASVSVSGATNSVDKIRAVGTAAAGVFTIQQLSATPPDGFSHYIRITTTTADGAPAAGSQYQFNHRIEGTYCQDLQFGIAANTKSVTLGFKVRSSLTGAFSGTLKNASVNRSYPFSFTISSANTWTAISVTIAADTSGTWTTSTTEGIRVTFDIGGGTTFKGTAGAWVAANLNGVTGAASVLATLNATFDLTGLQLEPGTVATTFEQRPFGDMLRLCQREYFKTFLQATAPVQNAGANTAELQSIAGKAGALAEFLPMAWPVVMRGTPAITTYNPAAANAQVRDVTAAADCSATATANLNERGVTITATGNAGTAVGNILGVHLIADARL